MAATKEDVDEWIEHAKTIGAKYIVSVCDTFEYDDYPVYCMTEKEREEAELKYAGKNMQRINETIIIET